MAAKIEEKCLIVQASVWARRESLKSTCTDITLTDAFCFSAKPRECLLNSQQISLQQIASVRACMGGRGNTDKNEDHIF